MLNVKNLSKAIDGRSILQNVTFHVQKGSITALLGRNGAGKTTLLQTVVGILDPDHGSVTYNDQDIFQQPQIKEHIVFVPDSNSLFKNYTVKEIIGLYEKIYPRFDQSYFKALLERFELPQQGTLRKFSKGMKAMFFIVLSFSTRAELIILDEPTNGLDPIIKRQMLQFVIEEVSENQVSLLLSTHQLAEVEAIADTILFLKSGAITEQASLDELKMRIKKVQIVLQGNDTTVLEQLKGIQILQRSGRVLTVLLTENSQESIETLRNIEPLLLEELPITLDDVFVSTLGGERYVI